MSQSSPHEQKRFGVLAPLAVDCLYDYLAPDDLSISIGDLVEVELGRKHLTAVVWDHGSDDKIPTAKLKSIFAKKDLPALSKKNRLFIDWVADYTMTAKGNILKLAMGSDDLRGRTRAKDEAVGGRLPQGGILKSDAVFSAEQACAIDALQKLDSTEGFCPVLLEGVTGAGKTEVYFEMIAKILTEQKQVLLLLPEIALTTQLVKRFEKRFGFRPALWHSDISKSSKKKIWQNILSGEIKAVIGARSALFLPYPDLGLIIVDEEHDSSYKQEEGVIYNARDMAIVRAKIEKIPILLVSATPSLETRLNAQSQKYLHLSLPSRYGVATLPEMKTIDMRLEKLSRQHFISEPLRAELKHNLEQREQSLLFLNRRGYAPLTLCRSCGHRFECPSCSAWLTEHRFKNKLVCHHCGHQEQKPKSCPACAAEDSLVACGPGVERIEEEITTLFPEARCLILASDAIAGFDDMSAAISAIEERQVDIIIGTQMIAKGHHFPHLTLVGIIDADLGLEGADLRAGERSFQLLQQVSGRAGRADLKGRVLIQSYMPDHKVIAAIIEQDSHKFSTLELSEREESLMPPFGRLAGLIVTGADEEKLDLFCRSLAKKAPKHERFKILGPAPAPLALLRGKHRRRFLIKADKKLAVQKMIKEWLETVKIPASISVKVDIDPYSFF